jgi:hypothetical protein
MPCDTTNDAADQTKPTVPQAVRDMMREGKAAVPPELNDDGDGDGDGDDRQFWDELAKGTGENLCRARHDHRQRVARSGARLWDGSGGLLRRGT